MIKVIVYDDKKCKDESIEASLSSGADYDELMGFDPVGYGRTPEEAIKSLNCQVHALIQDLLEIDFKKFTTITSEEKYS